MRHLDLADCQFRSSYDLQWHQARDSAQALRILKEVKLQRSKMRTYIRKMLEVRLALLRDQQIISPAEASEATANLDREVHVEEEDEDGRNAAATTGDEPRASPKKKQKKEAPAPAAAAAAASPVRNVDSDEEMQHAASVAAGGGVSARHDHVDTDTAVSRYDIHASALRCLQKEIHRLQTQAKTIHGKGHFLKQEFGQLSSDSKVRDRVCSICHEVIIEPALTVCGHYFDWHCLAKCLKNAHTPCCPMCRQVLGPEDYRAFSIDQLPAAVRYDQKTEASEEGQAETGADGATPKRSASLCHADVSSSTVPASVAAAASAAPAASASSSSSSSSSVVPALAPMPSAVDLDRVHIVGEGQHGSKIETICRYIKCLVHTNPSVKVLVFSQYHRMLEMVDVALFHNNIHSLHLAGTPMHRAKQIDQFQTDPHQTVLLMSLRTDNSGLTLVSATAVFLVEPSLNPSVEAQAVNRVHRIGQTAETVVFKFLMRDSVEQAIDELTTHAGDTDGTLAREAVPSGGESLAQQSKETLSVAQLLSVLDLADDKRDHQDAEEEEEAEPNNTRSV